MKQFKTYVKTINQLFEGGNVKDAKLTFDEMKELYPKESKGFIKESENKSLLVGIGVIDDTPKEKVDKLVMVEITDDELKCKYGVYNKGTKNSFPKKDADFFVKIGAAKYVKK